MNCTGYQTLWVINADVLYAGGISAGVELPVATARRPLLGDDVPHSCLALAGELTLPDFPALIVC